MYRILFQWGACDIPFPVGVCPGRVKIRRILWVQFLHGQVQGTVVILEEGSHPLSRCPKCYIFFTWRAIDDRNQSL